MKRTEIEDKVLDMIYNADTGFATAGRIVDLFVELGEELCKKQRINCQDAFMKSYFDDRLTCILNAPSPKID